MRITKSLTTTFSLVLLSLMMTGVVEGLSGLFAGSDAAHFGTVAHAASEKKNKQKLAHVRDFITERKFQKSESSLGEDLLNEWVEIRGGTEYYGSNGLERLYFEIVHTYSSFDSVYHIEVEIVDKEVVWTATRTGGAVAYSGKVRASEKGVMLIDSSSDTRIDILPDKFVFLIPDADARWGRTPLYFFPN